MTMNHRGSMTLNRFTLGALISLTALVTCPMPASAMSGYIDVAGAQIVAQTQLTPRTLSLTIASPSFNAPTMVEVTLPAGYGDHPTKRWPVTYYLAGTNQDQTSFRALYKGESLTASFPSIIVSPDGDSGYWSNWFNLAAGGPPMYETFVTEQLIPLIDANFMTIAKRSHRAIMGESMGGYSVMMMAARHPDLFVAASSLSGGPDTNTLQGLVLPTVSPALMFAIPSSIYGLRPTQAVRWRGHNPTDLFGNLRDVKLQVRTGNGVLDLMKGDTTNDVPGCAVEATVIQPLSESFHNTLNSAGISHTWQQYSWGCHSVALFGQEITDTLPGFLAAFGTAAPATFDYRGIQPTFSVYGWSVTADPARALEFLALEGVSADGLNVFGSGTTVITTPPLFTRLRPVTVTVNGVASTVVATAAGQIRFNVNLGAANAQQQYTIGSNTVVNNATVTFAQN